MHSYVYNTGKLFSTIAAAYGEKIALSYPDDTTISFSELENLSNKIAHYFIAKGLKKGDVIAIFNNKSPLGYSCMLAALKTGIIYTNLDLTSPFERIKKIVDRCAPKLICFDIHGGIEEKINEMGIPVSALYDNFYNDLNKYTTELPACTKQITGGDAAYIMFTSGSTGFPKGAVITHANLINFISWGQSQFHITDRDVFTNANPIYFDNSVFDFYISLFSGASLVPLTNDITHDSFALITAVAKAGCTVWFSVPSLLMYLMTTRALDANSLPSIKRFIFGGEGFPKSKLHKLYGMYQRNAQLYNVYGPTECTCICSAHIISDSDFEDMHNFATLGYLAPNFDYVLLNDPGSNFGELCLKGPNVGAGYYNDKERTGKSFIQNPHNDLYNEIVYKTGDLVSIDEKGHLHFKGRVDNQIKHMGYRIELEEIESLLNTLIYVNEAAVIYERINDTMGQIIAYVASNEITDENIVMAALKTMVPEYMVPRKMHVLKSLPKNQNGKIDKIALNDLKK